MNVYVVFDRQTGRIVHTASYYMMGNDEPVAQPEEEVLEMARKQLSGHHDLGVAKAPDDFDFKDRTRRLMVDPKTGVCGTYLYEGRAEARPGSRRAASTARRKASGKANKTPKAAKGGKH